jgi:hypothetical protein
VWPAILLVLMQQLEECRQLHFIGSKQFRQACGQPVERVQVDMLVELPFLASHVAVSHREAETKRIVALMPGW